MQWPLFPPKTDWEKPDLSTLPSWRGAKTVGFDLETCDPTIKTLGPAVRRGGFIAGYSFSLDGQCTVYVPLRHLGGNNVSITQGMAYLRDNLRDFDGELVGANLNYDLDYVLEAGCTVNATRFSDIQLAAALLSSLHRSYSMAAIAERLGVEGKDEHLLRLASLKFGIDPKGEMWKLPAEYVGPYAEQDARLPLTLIAMQKREMMTEGLGRVWDLESKLLPILVKMRRRGVRVDLPRFEEIRQFTLEQERESLARVKWDTGVSIGVGETSLDTLLDRSLLKMNVVAPRTRTGQPSIKNAWLTSLELPAADALVRAREVAKLRSTFIDGTLTHVINGRVHCTFKQIANDDGGARFGRMSCVKPNLQNQPAKDTELGDMLRSAFLPEEGQEWCSADYSSQEPRMLIHWAAKHGCTGAAAAAHLFKRDPDTDSHLMAASLIFKKPMAKVTDKERKMAKTIFLGLCYGMGSGKLAESLGLPTQKVDGGFVIGGRETMALLRKFNAAVPYVGELDRIMQREAKSNGIVRTLSGRICRFPLDDQGRYDWVRTALNREIQGSSADQTKMAMVAADEAGLPIQLQVHDEITMSVADREVGAALAEVMVKVCPLLLPSKVDVDFGPNWAAAGTEETQDAPETPQDAAYEDFWAKARPGQGGGEIALPRAAKKPVTVELW